MIGGGDLENKTVRIKNIRLLEFMYPNYIIKDKLFFDNESSVIYTGKHMKNLKEYLTNNTKSFINTVGPYEIDLDDKGILLNFVYSKWGKEPKKEVSELVLGLSDEDYLNYVKIYWVSGKSKVDEVGITIFDLYKALCKGKSELLKVYFNLLEFYDINMIESALFTFMEKSMKYEELSASGAYLLLLKEFRDKNRNKLKNLLLAYTAMDEPKKTKLMWFLMNL